MASNNLSKLYYAVERAADPAEALRYLFLSEGDALFIAEKRVAESFFIRGRHRKSTNELYSFISSSETAFEEEEQDEILAEESMDIIKGINTYIKSKIEEIESEFSNYSKVTKNITGLVMELKTIYSFILFKISSTHDLVKIIGPDLNKPCWVEILKSDAWDLSNLDNLTPLVNYTEKDYSPTRYDKETDLIYKIRRRIEYDRYALLDELITYFKNAEQEELADIILAQEFAFLNDTATGITGRYKLSKDQHNMINKMRINYISRVKIDLKYALVLINLSPTTYKSRSGKVKQDFIYIGEAISQNPKVFIDFVINNSI